MDRNAVTSYKEIIEELTTFVDTKFRYPSRMDEIGSERTLIPMFVLLFVSLILVIAYLWVSPILQWLPLGISLTALLIAGSSMQAALSQRIKKRLVRKEFERLWSIYPKKNEEARHLLLPLVAMKMENSRMFLHTLFEMHNETFDEDNLLKFYLVP